MEVCLRRRAITSSFDDFQDAVTLKQDGRRISLEGVLTGAALGILFLYMVEEIAAAAGRPQGGGPIEGPDVVDIGPILARLRGRPIPAQEEIDLGLLGPGPRPGGGQDPAPQGPARGLSLGLRDQGLRADGAPVALPPWSPRRFSDDDPGRRRASSGPEEPEPPPDPPPPPPPPVSRDLPLVLLVLVRTEDVSTGRAVEAEASAHQNPSQYGVEASTIQLQRPGGTSFQVLSDRLLQGSGISELDNATLATIAANAAMVNSQLFGGPSSDVYLLSARDLLRLGLISDGTATAAIRADTASLVDSRLFDSGGHNLLTLQANTELNFIGLGDSQRASLAFDLLTQGLRDSVIALGQGNDTLSILSGFQGGLGTIGLAASEQGPANRGDSALQFQLSDPVRSPVGPAAWSFSLNATAIGLQDSAISMGAGDDDLTITTQIDAALAADLGRLYSDPATDIQLQRIGLLRSSVDMGSGNDRLRINGAVIDSTINLGSGNNTLILEGDVLGSSRILSGSGRNQIVIDGNLGGSVAGGSGDDRFDLSSLPLAGEIHGGDGNDTLASTATNQRDLALIQGRDQGFLGGLRFRDVEGLELGSGDDVAVMSLEGTLTGRLLGGSGLDRLEFSNWELPVRVDLDLGQASPVYGGASGGISGFEQVVGGTGPDVIAASGAFSAIDGNEGDDVLFLRWTPWLSAYPEGLELHGGGGRDLVVIAGLEAALPPTWNGVSGIPVLSDLQIDLDPNSRLGDQLGWLRTNIGLDGSSSQEFLRLSPSGPEGIGDVRLLPIAPLDELISGIGDSTRQLAIAWDPSQNTAAELRLLGSNGSGSSRLIAYLPAGLPSREQLSLSLSSS
ncbi:MAG: hypothetical protein VKJ44_08110 [Synechococcus sp.]|nr:hypothetical protein [Synechococcus sp.]